MSLYKRKRYGNTYLSPSLSLRPVTPVVVISPAAVSLLTLGVTKSISSWLLVKDTMSSGSTSFTFFLFRFGFDGAGGYENRFSQSVSPSVYVCVCVRACLCVCVCVCMCLTVCMWMCVV